MTVKFEKVSSDDQKEVDVRKWANLTAGEPYVEDHFIREFNVETSAQPGGTRTCNFIGLAPQQVVINLLDVASLNTPFQMDVAPWRL